MQPQDAIFSQIIAECLARESDGQVATYIPELSQIDPKKFGVYLCRLDGKDLSFGDHQEPFSIQSISKVFTLAMAIGMRGEGIWSRVGVEPSGTSFNSLIQLELEYGKPRNPFINAGALVITDMLMTALPDPLEQLLRKLRTWSGNPTVDINPEVYYSEKMTGFRNAALANFLKSYHNLDNEVQAVLDLYYQFCSIEMSCADLARCFLVFANHGIGPDGERYLTASQTKRLNALMQTCGFYDESGEFAYRVGLPGKSGVGGGIVALHPKQYSIAVWSPPLNKKGNSVLAMHFLERWTDEIEHSIF